MPVTKFWIFYFNFLKIFVRYLSINLKKSKLLLDGWEENIDGSQALVKLMENLVEEIFSFYAF
jgi:hypothetical protein